MQKRVITPYPGAPDLSMYDDEDLDSAFSPKPEAELDHSCRYTGTSVILSTATRVFTTHYNPFLNLMP